MRDLRVSFFGDSLVAGVGDPAGMGWVGRLVAMTFATGAPITAYNLGVRRETSADVVARWTSELKPRLADSADCRVVFSFGVNDTTWQNGAPRIDRASSARNLERALAGARQRLLPAFVVGPAPVDDDAQHERIRTLSAALRNVADADGVPYVEIAESLRAAPDYRLELSAGDGAHPARGGYDRIAELVAPAWFDWLDPGPPRSDGSRQPAGRRARAGAMP